MGCLKSKDGEKGEKAAKKGAGKVVKTLEGLEWKEFKKLGADELDQWFDSVAEVVNTLAELGEACDQANEGILQLCEAKEMVDDGVKEKSVKSVFMYFVKTTKAKNAEVKIVESDGKITIEVSGEGCGAGWLIFDGIIKLLDALNTFVEKVPELIPKMEEFAEASKTMDEKLQTAAESAGLKAPIMLKNGASNLKIVAAIPNVMKKAVEAVKTLLTTIRDILQGKDVGEEAV